LRASLDLSQGAVGWLVTPAFQGYAKATMAASSSAATFRIRTMPRIMKKDHESCAGKPDQARGVNGNAEQTEAITRAVSAGPGQQPTLRNLQWRLAGDLDIPGPSGNDLSMDQISPLPALTQDEVRVAAWAEVREPLERQLAPLGWRALAALAPRPGECVLDIGCGGGETALDLARAVAPDGTVVGVDLSVAVLAFAQRTAKGCERVRFVQADAQVFPFEPASFDAAFSRFGVMFFADPTAAFINIRRSLRPNGRLAFVCWRALEENQLDILPLRAGSAHLPPQLAHDPDAPGPFAFANSDRVRGVLERAGFGEIEISARDEQVGSGDLDTMVAVCSRVGALGKILRENPELRAATLPAVRSALAAHDGPDGVRLNAATWVVTARAPAGL
jgi:SAM-dependent methyltransferase